MAVDPGTAANVLKTGLDIFGGFAGKKSAEHKKEVALAALQDLSTGRNAYINAFMENVKGGFDTARTSAKNVAESSRYTALQREQQLGSATQASLQNRGLYNSTLLDNAYRGISADTTRNLIEIDDSLGQILSNIDLKQTQAIDAVLERNLGIIEDKYRDYLAIKTGYQLGSAAPSTATQFDWSNYGAGTQQISDLFKDLGLFG